MIEKTKEETYEKWLKETLQTCEEGSKVVKALAIALYKLQKRK
jgi:hypothetical protein